MKKYIFLLVLLFLSINNETYAANCEYYKEKYETYYDRWINDTYNGTNNYDLYSEYWDKYNDCYDEFIEKFDKWYDSFELWNYLDASTYFKSAINYFPNDESTLNNLILSYYNLWKWFYNKWNFEESVTYLKLSDELWFKDKFLVYSDIWLSYINLEKYDKALFYYNKALKETYEQEKINFVNEKIKLINEYVNSINLLEDKKSKSPSNDTYSYEQTYIEDYKINQTWKSLTKNNEVIIAVIDDWININHPDLTDNIWINIDEIPWNGIDDDNNWYIDDFNGWNFASDNLINILPAWSHWTNVAWVIGASINNNLWISWIVQNVKIMNLRAFEFSDSIVGEDWWAYSSSIINAIHYAIDNWANIINLSLWSNQFISLNSDYNDVINKAYENDVILVIAAWNWDILSNNENWVNTTVNKISPVCNDIWNYKKIIWVWALDSEWQIANWSNYWNCVDFYLKGVDIATLSVKYYTGYEYEFVDWTSFSAPILTWIIWLWYNQFWKIKPSDIYDSLYRSLEINEKGVNQINSVKYFNELKNLEDYYILKDKYIDLFNSKIWNKLDKIPKNTLIKLSNDIDKYLSKNLENNIKAKLEALKFLIVSKID